jgi:large subunit ribosomal protein L10
MAKSRQSKEVILAQVKEKFGQSKAVVFADHTGLKVKDTEELRNRCKAENVEFLAVKKTLMEKILKELGFETGAIDFSGSLALIFGYDDEVAPARIAHQFARTNSQLSFRGGVVEGKIVDIVGVTALATLPTKNELYAKLVGSINAPISGFVNILAGNLRGLVTVLSAIKDNKTA